MEELKPEIYEGYVSDEGNVFYYSPAVAFEVHKDRMPTDILRIRRIYKNKPKMSSWFKSPKKIKNYIPVRIIVEYL